MHFDKRAEGLVQEQHVGVGVLGTEMTPDVLHEVVAGGVTDRFGNAVLGPYDRATFTGSAPRADAARPLLTRRAVADAILDRLVHNAYKLDLQGNSRSKSITQE